MARKGQPVPRSAYNLDTSKCEKRCKHKLFAVTDEDKTILFANADGKVIYSTLIDGCVVTEGVRADYIVSQDGVGHVVVEFKGHDLKKAYEQVCETSRLWKQHKVAKDEQLAGLIVCNRVPKAPKSSDLQLAYLRSHNGQLTVRSHYAGMQFKIGDLLRAD